MAIFPSSNVGFTCIAKIPSNFLFLKISDWAINLAPPFPSSPAWNISIIDFFNSTPLSICSFNHLAKYNRFVVCPSCPQACIFPFTLDLYSTSFSSWSGRASMSALNPNHKSSFPLNSASVLVPISSYSISKLSKKFLIYLAVSYSSNANSGFLCNLLLVS